MSARHFTNPDAFEPERWLGQPGEASSAKRVSLLAHFDIAEVARLSFRPQPCSAVNAVSACRESAIRSSTASSPSEKRTSVPRHTGCLRIDASS